MKPVNGFIPPSSRQPSSVDCIHQKLAMLPERRCRLQCRRCRSILPRETPPLRFCPRCLEKDRVKRHDFTETNIIDVSFARYQCEDCGMLIHAG